MKTRIVVSNVPSGSAINALLPGAYYQDCYSIDIPGSSRTALELFVDALAKTPPWVDFLMALRNKFVALVGMKNLGRLGEVDRLKPSSAYVPGDRVGIFMLISNVPNEVLLGVNEKHFDVVLSIYKHSPDQYGKQLIAQTTVVHVKNLVGRLYMLPVTPLHRVIAQATLSRLA